MQLLNKYLISFFMVVACCLQHCCWAQSTTVRPYKFGFTIDEQQHRSESRDERGIVMGEFGFITADGIYHVTVYATDEQGRFRILAMRNYPYESPPKTVEVMVQAKATPTTTTTTTAKPLPRHNFNNEACSGCFLTNGNNKPKGLNGIENKTVKSDIRPLSKSLPSAGSNAAAASPKASNKNTGTGNLSGLNGEHILLPINANKNAPKLNTPVTESLVFKDFVALQNAVKNQQLFSTAPSTFASVDSTLAPYNYKIPSTHNVLPNKIDSTLSTLAPNKDISTTTTLLPKDDHKKSSAFAPNKAISTTSTLVPHTKPSTFASIKVTPTTHSTLAPNKDKTTPSTFAPNKITTNVSNDPSSQNPNTSNIANSKKFLNDKNKSVSKTLQNPLRTQADRIKPLTFASKVITSTHSTLAPNKDQTKHPTFATNKITTNVSNDQSSQKPNIQNIANRNNFLNNKNKSVTKTLQNPLQTQTKISNNKSQHIAPLVKHQFQIVALSMTSDKGTTEITDKNKAIINTVLKPLKTKPIQFLKHNLPTKSTAQENTLPKIPSKDSLVPPFEGNLNTDTTAQGNTLTRTPQKNLVASTATEGKEIPVKHALERLDEAKVFPQAASPETVNKISGKQSIQTPPNTNTLNKQYTSNPTVSKDTNQRTPKPLSGSPAAAGTTGNPPPIMDIIMQKVLPAIMGKTTPASSASPTLNKSNAVPSGKKPGGTSGPSSVNGDGDLYRFKYILDYHGHTETGKRNGNKEGSYFAIGDDDVERTIEYVANENGYQPRIRWRKLDSNEIKSKENTLKDYEFVWFNQ